MYPTNFSIPSDVLLTRWQNTVDQVRADLAKVPKRRFIRRRMFAAIIATLRYEIEELESLITISDRLQRTGDYQRFAKGSRVQATSDAGFHKGAIGTVEMQEPDGLFRVWVLRDGASALRARCSITRTNWCCSMLEYLRSLLGFEPLPPGRSRRRDRVLGKVLVCYRCGARNCQCSDLS